MWRFFSKSAGTISVDEYSISDGQFTLLTGPKKGTQVVGFGAKLKLTFLESDPKCCCQNGKYRWYQTITKDNDPTYEKERVPRPDTGPPNLAPLYGAAFSDSPLIDVNSLVTLFRRKPGKKQRIDVEFKLEFQCEENGTARTLETIEWGMWAEQTSDDDAGTNSKFNKGLK